MALRGALTHRKTRRLAKLLSMPLPCALGIMEALWHVTSEQAPTGAIGRLTNQDIADEMFWDDDADALIAALVSANILDEHPVHRLSVHGWAERADDATHMKVARAHQVFACGTIPKLRRFTSAEREQLSAHYAHAVRTEYALPEPEPVPEPVSEPEPVSGGASVPQAKPQPTKTTRAIARPGSESEVWQYAQSIGLPEHEAKKWLDRNEAIGWVTGKAKTPVKDWKASLRTWLNNYNEFQGNKQAAQVSGPAQERLASDDVLDRMNQAWRMGDEGGAW